MRKKRIAVADIETNGLLDELDTLYCASVRDFETNHNNRFRSVLSLVKHLATFDEVWFHNGCTFDYQALCKLLPSTPDILPRSKVKDTLVLSRLLFPDLAKLDAFKFRKYGRSYPLPSKLTGSHALGAWGYRLGDYKGDFNPADYTNPLTGEPHTWNTVGYSEDMAIYCDQDTLVTRKLLQLLFKQESTKQSVDLEHDIAWLMYRQEFNGFRFDVKGAVELYGELCVKRVKAINQLVKVFGTWYAANGKTIPKRTINYKVKERGDLTEGAPYTKIKVITFNPASRLHAARCFKQWYGWTPTAFTDSGEPQIDAEVLEKLPFKEAAQLKDFYDINKLIGQLGDGKNAWLKLEKNGWIHGRVNPNGAGTGRATHSRPNVAQVPKGAEGTYGHRCRELFGVPLGWVLLGTDASGLELRCLGNALAPFDGGAYADIVVNGDIHWVNVLALGLMPKGTVRDKKNPEHEAARDLAKTWIYAFLYGAGNELLGSHIGYTEAERDAWRIAGKHKKVIAFMKKKGERPTPVRVCHTLKGEELRNSFLKEIPAVKKFQQLCKDQHKDDGGIYGLDGRFIKTRSAHSATNFRLQGDGALVCKLWGVLLEKLLISKGLKHGWDGDFAFCAWVHDEYQIACRSREVAELAGACAKEAMKQVGETFGFACQLDADFDIGNNWSETH
jgi:hypothetical protein